MAREGIVTHAVTVDEIAISIHVFSIYRLPVGCRSSKAG
jgi:hypothetical protein